MRIREKKIGTLSTEIGPAATKIVKFWSGVKWGKINMCHKIKKFSNGLMNHFPRYWIEIPKFDNYHPP